MLGIDLINICILNKYKVSIPILDKIHLVRFLLPHRCEESPIPWDYCQSIGSYKTVSAEVPQGAMNSVSSELFRTGDGSASKGRVSAWVWRVIHVHWTLMDLSISMGDV